MSQQQMLLLLKRIPYRLVDCLAILNATASDEFKHLDTDVLVVLARKKQSTPSNFEQLRDFTSAFKTAVGKTAFGFASFRQQMYYMAELKRQHIQVTPYHLIVYPDTHHFSEWEIPSRVRSMIRTAAFIHCAKKWHPPALRPSTTGYSPSPFLQLLYEAHILHAFAGIESLGLHWDVIKTIEFAVKNLAIEALMATEGATKEFNTSWKYLLEHLPVLDEYGLTTAVVREALRIRTVGYSRTPWSKVPSYLEQAFAFYDHISTEIFQDDNQQKKVPHGAARRLADPGR